MSLKSWWEPGQSEGWLSRKWAQAHVFALPPLKPSELEASVRYRAQALLPSLDVPLTTRVFTTAGKVYGLAIVDRIPEPRPDPARIALGMPLQLPARWPAACLLAVATPEGWEFHRYENRVLATSYPPVQNGSSVLKKLLSQNDTGAVFWTAPDAGLSRQGPDWAEPAPPWPANHPWGIPWTAAPLARWPWVLGGLLLATGALALALAGYLVREEKMNRNTRWETWVKAARPLAGSALSAPKTAAAQAQAEQPLEEVLSSLAAWGSSVEIRRLELRGGKISVTARAASALSAAALLSQDSLGSRLRVLQIRPIAGGEEFDLEGTVLP